MKKKIDRTMAVVSVIGVLLTCVITIGIFYEMFDEQSKKDVQSTARLLQKSLNFAFDDESFLQSLGRPGSGMRLTLVDKDGAVRYDSITEHSTLENHGQRPEIQGAMSRGYGEQMRYSQTMGKKTYYYALALDNEKVIRVARTEDSIYGIMLNYLPYILILAVFCVILSSLTASRLTGRIIAPINKIDLDVKEIVCYDELTPFVRKIYNQRKHIHRQMLDLAERAETMAGIMNGMNEGLILTDNRCKIALMNQGAKDIFGTNEDCTGKGIGVLTRNNEVLERLDRAVKGQRSEYLWEIEGKSYNLFFSSLEGRGAIVFMLDITDKAEGERRRREFTANVSHELKTPLTTISGFAELISSNMADGQTAVAFAGRIREDARRLLALIEDIIRLSELDEGQGKESLKEINLAEIIKSVGASLEHIAKERDVEIKLDVSPCLIKGNRGVIEEIIFNLTDNAIKYNIKNGYVLVSLSCDGENAIVKIKDTGIGIPKEDIDRVFERFYRVDKSRSKKTGGTGLGLSIVKHGVLMHGGKITLASKEGVGTEIAISLPKIEAN